MKNVDDLVLDISDINDALYNEETVMKQAIDLRFSQIANLVSENDLTVAGSDLDSIQTDIESLELSVDSLNSVSEISIQTRIDTAKQFDYRYGLGSGKKFVRIHNMIYEISNSYNAISHLTKVSAPADPNDVEYGSFKKVQTPIFKIPFDNSYEPLGTYQYDGGIYFASFYARKTAVNTYEYRVYRTDPSFKSTSYLNITINVPVGNDASFAIDDGVPLVSGLFPSKDGKTIYVALFDNTLLRYSVTGNNIGQISGPITTVLDDIWTVERDLLSPAPSGASITNCKALSVLNVAIDKIDADTIYVMGTNLNRLNWDSVSLTTVSTLTEASMLQGAGVEKRSLHQSYVSCYNDNVVQGLAPADISDVVIQYIDNNAFTKNLIFAIVNNAVLVIDGFDLSLAQTLSFDGTIFSGPNYNWPTSTPAQLKTLVPNNTLDYGIWVLFDDRENTGRFNYTGAFLGFDIGSEDIAVGDVDFKFTTVIERSNALTLNDKDSSPSGSVASDLTSLNAAFINNNGFLDVYGVASEESVDPASTTRYVYQNTELASDIYSTNGVLPTGLLTCNYVTKGITHVEISSLASFDSPGYGKNMSQIFQVGNTNSNSLLYKELTQ